MEEKITILLTPQQATKILKKSGVETFEKFRVLNGFSNTVYDINDKYILKCDPHKSHVIRESAGINRVREFSNTPILGTGTFQGLIKYHYMLLLKLPGENLGEHWINKNSEEQIQLAKGIAGKLKELHQIKLENYSVGWFQTRIHRWNGTWVDGNDRYTQSLYKRLQTEQFPLGLSKILEHTKKYYLTHRASLEQGEKKPAVLHGDFHLHNVLETNNEIIGFVDWEWVMGGERLN
jgi:aminoglycoside phosphotransferase (APT) family kinase protein